MAFFLRNSLLFTFCSLLHAPASSQTSDLPKAFRQIVPRGRIAAIINPQFVPADRAKIADDAWILGVVIDGQAHAYSLNLLNRHEVVNDQIGATPFAAVW
jgi:carotenoid cleavage dioxygenase-like enzyme